MMCTVLTKCWLKNTDSFLPLPPVPTTEILPVFKVQSGAYPELGKAQCSGKQSTMQSPSPLRARGWAITK